MGLGASEGATLPQWKKHNLSFFVLHLRTFQNGVQDRPSLCVQRVTHPLQQPPALPAGRWPPLSPPSALTHPTPPLPLSRLLPWPPRSPAAKFRHVFADPAKPEQQFTDLELSPVTGDHNYIRGNNKFFAVSAKGGGGPVLVLPYSAAGKLPRGYPLINGHSGAVRAA